MPTVAELVTTGAERLAAGGVPEPRADAEVLVARALGRDRTWLYAHPDDGVPADAAGQAAVWLERRQHREPLWYIVGEVEFYGLACRVDPHVLIPRPETELLVEAGLAFLRHRPAAVVADICTGSGCVAIALARHAPEARLLAVDLDPAALAVARRNADRHGLGERIAFLQGDLWAPLPGPVDLAVCNPPYVAERDWPALMPEVREHEPRRALAAGEDGLAVIRRLLAAAPGRLAAGGALYVEIGANQGAAVRELAKAAFPQAKVAVRPDLAGLDRLLVVERE